MKIIGVIILLAVVLVWGFMKSVKEAPYFDDEKNRFIPKDEEEAYLKRTREKHEEMMKKINDK